MITVDRKRLERVLRTVEKPGRYIGGEWNQVRKDPRKVKAKVALVFPDAYEIGMSYLGQKILYHILNARPDILAERVFAPWPDFEQGLREAGLPLYSLENRIPLHEFDIVGVSLLYELNYSNILTVLDLGGIPVLASERDRNAPFVIAGGPAAFNPEPVADFFDLFLLGDGEEAFPEIVEKIMSLKEAGADRRTALRELSKIQGVYVPSLYEAEKTDRSPLVVPRPIGGAPARIEKRVLKTFANSEFPDRIVVPGVGAVFDRVAIEAARGCPQNCRFCQAIEPLLPLSCQEPRQDRPDDGPKPLPHRIRGRFPDRPVDQRLPLSRGNRPRPHGRAGGSEGFSFPFFPSAQRAFARDRGKHRQGAEDGFHSRSGSRDGASAPCHQQEARRPRDPGRPDVCLFQGLEARQALFHGRPPHRDRRRPGRDRVISSETS